MGKEFCIEKSEFSVFEDYRLWTKTFGNRFRNTAPKIVAARRTLIRGTSFYEFM